MIRFTQEETASTPFMLRPPGAEELHTFALSADGGEDDKSKSGGKAEKLRVRASWVTGWIQAR